jgi:dienelactone hydrolase
VANQPRNAPAENADGLPTPDGPFTVGSFRTRLRSDHVHAALFYPAVDGTGSDDPGPYLYGFTEHALAAGESPAFKRGLHKLKGSARPRAVPLGSGAPWPAVILSPAYGESIEFSTTLAERLASHGFVVAAIATTEEEFAAADDDKTIARFSRLRIRRVTEVLDMMEQLAPVCGLVDTRRVAVGGHSLGGSEATLLAANDERIAAVFSLDGWHFVGTAPAPLLEVPALLVDASIHRAPESEAAVRWLQASPHAVAVGLLNAEHHSVTDLPACLFALPVDRAEVGSIGPAGTTDTSAIVLRFLTRALSRPARLASASDLVAGLPSTTSDPFGLDSGTATPRS